MKIEPLIFHWLAPHTQLFKDKARNTPYYSPSYENHGRVVWQLFETDHWPRTKPYTFWVTGKVSQLSCYVRMLTCFCMSVAAGFLGVVH